MLAWKSTDIISFYSLSEMNVNIIFFHQNTVLQQLFINYCIHFPVEHIYKLTGIDLYAVTTGNEIAFKKFLFKYHCRNVSKKVLIKIKNDAPIWNLKCMVVI